MAPPEENLFAEVLEATLTIIKKVFSSVICAMLARYFTREETEPFLHVVWVIQGPLRRFRKSPYYNKLVLSVVCDEHVDLDVWVIRLGCISCHSHSLRCSGTGPHYPKDLSLSKVLVARKTFFHRS